MRRFRLFNYVKKSTIYKKTIKQKNKSLTIDFFIVNKKNKRQINKN